MNLVERSVAFLAPLAVALAVVGCGGEDDGNGNGTGPDPVIEGSYQLATYDGAAVATMVGQSEGCDEWVTGGTLLLRADRTHERTEIEESRNCEDPVDNETRTVTATGTWLLVGQTLQLDEGTGIGTPEIEGTWNGSDAIDLTFTTSAFGGGETVVTRGYAR